MKKSLFLILFIAIAIFSCKENPVTNNYGSINCYVYDKETNLPIEGAFVTTAPPSTTIKSGADGKLTIPDIAPNYYSITAIKEGYRPSSITVQVVAGKENTCILPMVKSINDTNISKMSKPYSPIPQNNITLKQNIITLSWLCDHPMDMVVKYDVFFGETPNNLSQIAKDIQENSYTHKSLQNGKKYFWMVKAKDANGNILSSDLWSFTIDNDFIVTVPSDFYIYLPFDNSINDFSTNHWQTYSNNDNYIHDRFGILGKALNFGNNGNLIIDDERASDYGSSGLTMSVWLKPNSYAAKSSFGTHIGLVTDTLSKFYFGITMFNEIEVWTTNQNWVGTTQILRNNEWSHVAFVFDQTNQNCAIYINGNLAAEGFLPKISINQLTKLQVGGRNQFGDQYAGGMDDLRVYKRALSINEIKSLAH